MIPRYCIIGILFLAPLVYADYHYASHSGSNIYPYTSWETAADSITAAMRAADPYDTVYIGAGDYDEMLRIPEADTCLTFIGAGIDSTRCFTYTDDLWLVSDRTVVRNIWFEIDRAYRSCFGGWIGAGIIAKQCKFSGHELAGGVLGAGDSTIIEECIFEGMAGPINVALFTDKLIITNCYIIDYTNQVRPLISGDWAVGIIKNNIIIGNGRGLFCTSGCGVEAYTNYHNNYIENVTRGPMFVRTRLAEVSNNTIRQLYSYPDAIYSAFSLEYEPGEHGKVIFKNNAITDGNTGIAADLVLYGLTHDTVSIRYNGFWNNAYSDIVINDWNNVDTIGNIHSFPLYANPDSHDVHLQINSPFIDAGDPNILDVDGTRSDIGVYGGPGGTSYEYLDLPPRRPYDLSVYIYPFPFGDSIYINWHVNYEADFLHYEVYRDTFSGFAPSPFNLVANPETSYFADGGLVPTQDYFYRIRAVDSLNQASAYSEELPVYLSGIWGESGVEKPSLTQIEQNYPNPFNSSTTIVYTVADLGPIPAQINIDIYDIQGRKVRNLLDTREEVGKHRIVWDGRDDDNRELASGIYFARITQWHVEYLSKSQKLVLVR
jgi:hypothetical protein